MKHIAFPHPWITAHRTAISRPGQPPATPRGAKKGAAKALRRLAAASGRAAAPTAASVVDHAPVFSHAQVLLAHPTPTTPAATRWQRPPARSVAWVERLVLVLLVAFFGGGQVAILCGL
jgi:hypothetical protein